MKSIKPMLVVAGMLAAALFYIQRYYKNSERLALNEKAIRDLVIGMKAWEANDSPLTDDLDDLVEVGILNKVPQYLSATGRLQPFIFNAGVSDPASGNLVPFAAPENEPSGKRLLAHNDSQVEYLPNVDATTAIEHTRAEVRPDLERIVERKRERERRFGKDRGEIKPTR